MKNKNFLKKLIALILIFFAVLNGSNIHYVLAQEDATPSSTTNTPPPTSTTNPTSTPAPTQKPTLTPASTNTPAPTKIATPTPLPKETSNPSPSQTPSPTPIPTSIDQSKSSPTPETETSNARSLNPDLNITGPSVNSNMSARIKTPIEVTPLEKKLYKADEKISTKVLNTQNNNIRASVYDSDNNEVILNIQKTISDNSTKVDIYPPYDLKPGNFQLKIYDETGKTEKLDFQWGLLSINTNKSTYVTGEEALLDITVLDEEAKPVCNSDLTLKIQSEKAGVDEELSTKNNTITKNPNCKSQSSSNNADYQAKYKVKKEGTYILTLTDNTNKTTKTITDFFTVKTSVPVTVDRQTANRIKKQSADQPVILQVTANEDFSGQIVETVPQSFDVKGLDKALTYSSVDTAPYLPVINILGIPTNSLRLPFDGNHVKTLGFGEISDNPTVEREYKDMGLSGHDGIDFDMSEGTPIKAVDDGQVELAKMSDYGQTIVIKHSWGNSYYGHLSRIDVKENQQVKQGEIIGFSGQSGFTTGPHLHFGIKPLNSDSNNGFYGKIDPTPYLIPNASTANFFVKKIVWDVNLKKGATKTLGYTYNITQESSKVYLLGPTALYKGTDYVNNKAFLEESRIWKATVDNFTPPVYGKINQTAKRFQVKEKDNEILNVKASEYPESEIDLNQAKFNNANRLNIKSTLKHKTIKDVEIAVDVNIDSNKKLIITPKKINHLTPGVYTLTATIPSSSGNINITQDFAWGVLAFNFDKTVYKTGETAHLAYSVLTSTGETMCNAIIETTITSPSGKTTVQKTDDNTIKYNPECGKKTIDAPNDYESEYKIKEDGSYKVSVFAKQEEGWTITDEFQSQPNPSFSIERKGPTRIYPFDNVYPYEILITPTDDFNGIIKETVPLSFEISNVSDNGKVDSTQELKTITWQINIKKNVTKVLTYSFLAPPVSPEFYLLGPLKIADFTEIRSWQIASDKFTNTTCRWTGGSGTSQDWQTSGNWDCAAVPQDVGGGNGTAYWVEIENTKNNPVLLNNTSISINALNIGIRGASTSMTINGSGNLTIEATGTAPSGIFVEGAVRVGAGTLNLNPSGSARTCLSTVEQATTTIASASGTITSSNSTCTWDNNAVTGATLTAAGTISGQFSMNMSTAMTFSGTVNMTAGTFTRDTNNTKNVTCNSSSRANTKFYNFTVSNTTSLVNSCTFVGQVNVSANTLNTGTGTHESTTTGTAIANSGTFTATAGNTWIFSGSGSTIASSALTFDNVTISSSGTVNEGANHIVGGTLIVTTGTFAIGSNNLTVGSSGTTNSGSIKVVSGAAISQSSSGTTTITSSAGGSNCIGANTSDCSGASPGTIGFYNLTIGNGTVAHTTTMNGTSTLITVGNNFTVTPTASTNTTFTMSGTSPTLTVTGTLTLNVNGSYKGVLSASGTINVGSNFTNSGTFTRNTSEVVLNGSGTQTLSGATTFNKLTVSNAGGRTITFPASTTTAVDGLLTLTGTSCASKLTLNSSSPGTNWTINATSTTSLSYLDIYDSTASTGLTATYSSKNTATSGWTISSVCTYSIGGTVYDTTEGTPITSQPLVRVKVNGLGDYSANANGSGVYSINVGMNQGDSLTVYLDTGGGANPVGATFTRSTGSTMSSIHIYQDRAAMRCDNGGCDLTNDDVYKWDKTGDGDIHANVDNASGGTLTVDNDWKLLIVQNFAPGGTVITSSGGSPAYGGDIQITATGYFNMLGQSLTVGGSGQTTSQPLINNGGIGNPSTLTYTGSGTTDIDYAGGNTLIINGTGPFNAKASFTFLNYLRVSSGTFNLGAYNITLGQNDPYTSTLRVASGATLTQTSGTTTLTAVDSGQSSCIGGDDSVTCTGNVGSISLYNLTIGDAIFSPVTIINGNSPTVTVAGTLNVANLATLRPNATSTIVLSKNGTPLTKTGTLDVATLAGSTFKYTSTSGVTALSSASTTYHNLTIEGTGTFNAGTGIVPTVNGDLTVTSGTFAVGSNNLTVGSTANLNSGNIKVASGATLSQGSSNTTFVYSSTSGPGVNCIGSNGSSCSGTAGTIGFGTLTIGNGSLATTTKINGTNAIVTVSVGATLNIAASAILQPMYNTIINIAGATPITRSGTFDALTYPGSTVILSSTTGSSAVNNAVMTTTNSFWNLEINSSGQAFILGADITTKNNLTITAGTLDTKNASNYAVTIGGNYYNNGTLTARQSTVTFDSGGQPADIYDVSNQGGSTTLGSGVSRTKIGQSFTAVGGNIAQAVFSLSKFGTPTGNMTAELYTHSGTYGTNSVGSGTVLATSDPVEISTLTTSARSVTFNFSAGNQYTLTNGAKYVIAVSFSGGNASSYLLAGEDFSSATHSGNESEYTSGGSWGSLAPNDAIFNIYESNPGSGITKALYGTLDSASAFYKTVFNSSGDTWTINNAMKVSKANGTDTFTLTAGTVTLGDNSGTDNLEIDGKMVISSGATFQTLSTLSQGTTITLDINSNSTPPSCANCIVDVSGTMNINKNATLRLNSSASVESGVEVSSTGALNIKGSADVSDTAVTSASPDTKVCASSGNTFTASQHNNKRLLLTSGLSKTRQFTISATTVSDGDCSGGSGSSVTIPDSFSTTTASPLVSGTGGSRVLELDDTTISLAGQGIGYYLHDLTHNKYFLIVNTQNNQTCELTCDIATVIGSPDDLTNLDSNPSVKISNGIKPADTYKIIDDATVTANSTNHGYIYSMAQSQTDIQYTEISELGATGSCSVPTTNKCGITAITINNNTAGEGFNLSYSYIHDTVKPLEGSGLVAGTFNDNYVTAGSDIGSRAIHLASNSNNTVFDGNRIEGNGSMDVGISLQGSASPNVVVKNNIISGIVSYTTETANDSTNTVFYNNTAFNGTLTGFHNDMTNSITYADNTAYNCVNGMRLYASDNLRVAGNYVFRNTSGISAEANATNPSYLIDNTLGFGVENSTRDIDFVSTNNKYISFNDKYSSTTNLTNVPATSAYLASFKNNQTAGSTKIWGQYPTQTDNAETPQLESTQKFNYSESLYADSFTPHIWFGTGAEQSSLSLNFNGSSMIGSLSHVLYRITYNGTNWDVFKNETSIGTANKGGTYTDTSTNATFTAPNNGPATGDSYTFIAYKTSGDSSNQKTTSLMQDGNAILVTSGTILELKGQNASSNPSIITRGSTGGYHIDVGGTLDAQYYQVDYLGGTSGGTGLYLKTGATITNLANGTFNNFQNVGSTDAFITIDGDVIGSGTPSKTWTAMSFTGTGTPNPDTPEYTFRMASTGNSNYWNIENATCTGWSACNGSESESGADNIRWTTTSSGPSTDQLMHNGQWFNSQGVKQPLNFGR